MYGTLGTGSRPSVWRARWAALGAAVAVTVGGSGFFIAHAVSSSPSVIVTIDPVRVLDTRFGNGIGLVGPFISSDGRHLPITGPIETASGTQVVVPAGATGVSLNVTVVEPQAAGFVSVRPSDSVGAPSTSNLNFEAGDVVANAVTVQLPSSGPLEGNILITYDALGVDGPAADILADVVGYFQEPSAGPVMYTKSTGSDPIPAFTGPTPSRKVAVVLCEFGHVATGGGFESFLNDPTSGVVIEDSRPMLVSGSHGWRVTARNENVTNVGVFNIYVICLDPAP